MKIGFHVDAFNSAYFSFDQCLQWVQQNGVHYIECGLMDGVSWLHGLGYWPHIAMYEDPVLLRRKMETYGVQFSQVDTANPLADLADKPGRFRQVRHSAPDDRSVGLSSEKDRDARSDTANAA